MAKQLFSANSYLYTVVDNSAAGNYGTENFNPTSATLIAGAGGYDNCIYDKASAGAVSQFKNTVTGGNGSIPDFLVSPLKTVSSVVINKISWSNPS
jgi:hypothetical protein